jgi:6,7-dimethyl-8-ribityllumazine synthase
MPRVIEGQLTAAGLKFAIVVSRFNGFIGERLLGGAMDALARTGGQPDDIEVVKVPGSWKLPVVVRELARQKRHDAIICLGAVIRGETPHFDYVAGEAVKGIGHVACGLATHWSRPSTARAPRAAIRDSMRPWPPSRWPT